MKKLLSALAIAIAMLTTCLVGCSAEPSDTANDEQKKETAAAVFTLDVNPSVRVYVNEDSTVIAVEATNKDGEAIVSEIDAEGIDYEAAVEKIIDKMEEKGYLNGEESSVLISVEKKKIEISEKINEKINKTFEKHGKKASVIEQELDEIDAETEKHIEDIAKKHNISKGKAHLIEKIREEFPELSEEDLAKLKVNDLGIMLEETSDDVKESFKKIGKAVEEAYVGKDAALTTALESLEISEEDITMARVRVTRNEGKMLYEASFVYEGTQYEITVDAETGEILSTESKEFEEFDAKGFIDEFCGKNNIYPEELKDKFINGFFGKDEHNNENGEAQNTDKILTRGELLKKIIEELAIDTKTLKKTDVKIHETESGTVCSVIIESNEGDVYELVVEAYNGTILNAKLNGTEIDFSAEAAE